MDQIFHVILCNYLRLQILQDFFAINKPKQIKQLLFYTKQSFLTYATGSEW